MAIKKDQTKLKEHPASSSNDLLECAAWHQDQSETYASLMALTHLRGDGMLGDLYAELSQMHQDFANAIKESEAL